MLPRLHGQSRFVSAERKRAASSQAAQCAMLEQPMPVVWSGTAKYALFVHELQDEAPWHRREDRSNRCVTES